MSQIKSKDYKGKYIDNNRVEWLIEHGNKDDLVFFKGATGDRYTIYIFTKRNHNTIDISTVWNQYSHDTDEGDYLGYIKDYILYIKANKKWGWRSGSGDIVKQLMRQGVCPLNPKLQYKIRYCRSAYFMKTHDGNEFNPWMGIKVNLRTGLLVNKPTKTAKIEYNKAKDADKAQRRRNYIANRENTRALKRYRDAGGDTDSARSRFVNGRWTLAITGTGIEKINWDMIPMDDVFRHRNATLRSNIIEHYGMNAIINSLDSKVVNEDTIDGRYYRLLNVTIPDFSNNRLNSDSYQGLYLEMINPSTGESHFEGVPNADSSSWNNGLKEATVKAALSWRDNDHSIQTQDSWRGGNTTSQDEYVRPIILK